MSLLISGCGNLLSVSTPDDNDDPINPDPDTHVEAHQVQTLDRTVGSAKGGYHSEDGQSPNADVLFIGEWQRERLAPEVKNKESRQAFFSYFSEINFDLSVSKYSNRPLYIVEGATQSSDDHMLLLNGRTQSNQIKVERIFAGESEALLFDVGDENDDRDFTISDGTGQSRGSGIIFPYGYGFHLTSSTSHGFVGSYGVLSGLSISDQIDQKAWSYRLLNQISLRSATGSFQSDAAEHSGFQSDFVIGISFDRQSDEKIKFDQFAGTFMLHSANPSSETNVDRVDLSAIDRVEVLTGIGHAAPFRVDLDALEGVFAGYMLGQFYGPEHQSIGLVYNIVDENSQSYWGIASLVR